MKGEGSVCIVLNNLVSKNVEFDVANVQNVMPFQIFGLRVCVCVLMIQAHSPLYTYIHIYIHIWLVSAASNRQLRVLKCKACD